MLCDNRLPTSRGFFFPFLPPLVTWLRTRVAISVLGQNLLFFLEGTAEAEGLLGAWFPLQLNSSVLAINELSLSSPREMHSAFPRPPCCLLSLLRQETPSCCSGRWDFGGITSPRGPYNKCLVAEPVGPRGSALL